MILAGRTRHAAAQRAAFLLAIPRTADEVSNPMDDPRDISPDPDPPKMPSEQALLTMMDESDRDMAEGRLVALSEVLADLETARKRARAKRVSRRT